MRPRGTGRIWKRGDIYWIQYHRQGKQYRESTKSTDRKKAEALLKKRLYEIANDKFKRVSKATVADLISAAVDEAVTLKRRSISTTKGRANLHLVPLLGDQLASELNASDVRGYIKTRQKQGAESATINRELALLRRAYRLGMREQRIDVMPYIPRMDESENVRQGYLEHSDYLKLRSELPKGIDLLLVVGYHLGCRLGELRKLKWSMVDLPAKEIRIPAAISKTKKARTLPIYGDMEPCILAAKAERDEWWPHVDWVFIRRGQRVGAHLRGWAEACKRAKVPTLRFHDLRRSAVRNMERAGIPRSNAMAITGHQTEATYRRYAIVAESDKSLTVDRMERYFGSLGPKLGPEAKNKRTVN